MNHCVVGSLHNLGLLVLFVAGIGVTYYVIYLQEKKRREAMRRLALHMGFEFLPRADMNTMGYLSYFSLGTKGHSRYGKNLLQGNILGMSVSILDYSYVVRSSGRHNSNHTTTQTVVLFHFPETMRLPEFTLRTENFLDKIVSAFGYIDINFANDLNFSNNYRLHGKDDQAVRQLFNENIRVFLFRRGKLCVECSGSGIIIFLHGVCAKPEGVQSFITTCTDLLNLFVGASNRSTTW